MSGLAQKLHLKKGNNAATHNTGAAGVPLGAPMYGAPLTGAPMGGMTGAPLGAPMGGMATDYNHNGIPDQLEGGMQNQQYLQQQQFGQQGMVGHQTIVRPAIVQETVRTDRIVEVQPVIHREVDQTTINHIQQHITQAPAPQMGGVVQMAPIVQETIRPQVIDEITPVIHRQVATAVVERIEEHQSQRVVAPTQHTQQVVFQNQQAGLVGQQGVPTATVSGTDFNHNGIPDQLEGNRMGGLNQGGLNQGFNQGGLNQGGLNQGRVGGLNDLNRDGIPDNLEGGSLAALEQRRLQNQGLNQGGLNQGGLNQGLNQGGLNQGRVGGLNDLNRDGIPDKLEGGSLAALEQRKLQNQSGLNQPGMAAGGPRAF